MAVSADVRSLRLNYTRSWNKMNIPVVHNNFHNVFNNIPTLIRSVNLLKQKEKILTNIVTQPSKLIYRTKLYKLNVDQTILTVFEHVFLTFLTLFKINNIKTKTFYFLKIFGILGALRVLVKFNYFLGENASKSTRKYMERRIKLMLRRNQFNKYFLKNRRKLFLVLKLVSALEFSKFNSLNDFIKQKNFIYADRLIANKKLQFFSSYYNLGNIHSHTYILTKI